MMRLKRVRFAALLGVMLAVAGVGACPEDDAREILRTSGVQGGLVVHVGCGDGGLTAALRVNDRLLVHGLDGDADRVAQVRETIQARGLYGPVAAQVWNSGRLPYAENTINLLVVSAGGAVAQDEALRALAPGGVVCRQQNGRWVKTVKPWPGDIDQWTHWLHGADGNAVAQDAVAGPPRRLQWIAKPLWMRHHNTAPSVSAMVSAGGRLFYIVDEAPPSMDASAPDRWALVARDAFNGLPLWRKEIADWGWRAWSADWKSRFTTPTHISRRLVAIGDRVYVTLGFNAPLTELDAATGEVLRTFAGTERTDEILYDNGLLILSLNKETQRPGPLPAKGQKATGDPPVTKAVAAIDAKSGELKWRTGDFVGLRSKSGSMDRISHLSMCAGGGRVYFVDRDQLVALALADGSEAWRISRPRVDEQLMRYDIRITDMTSLLYHDGAIYFAQLEPDRRIDWREIAGRLHAFSAKTGEALWDRRCASWGWAHMADVFAIDGLIWTHDYQEISRTQRQGTPRSAAELPPGEERNTAIVGLDPKTGEVRRKLSNLDAFDNGHHHRCYRNKATSRFLLTSHRGFEFIPLDGGETKLNHWVRGTCRLGAIPCNGLLYATPHPCDCYITSKLNGFLALAPAGEIRNPKAESRNKSARLEKGSAFGEIKNQKSKIKNAEDWPTYRRDFERSGVTASPVAAKLKEAWRAEVGGGPTACVAVGDAVFVAAADSRQVLAFDARDGKERWRFTVGGRVDTPPTVDSGGVYFGCADGWMYCLRAADGRLAWRFRGAPEERLVGAFGGIESAWPIHGSVVVQKGAVHFTAGRSSLLDGGIFTYSLDARTGKVLSEKIIDTPYSMKVAWGRSQEVDTGLLSDVLVRHGDSIYMRQRNIFPGAGGDAGGEPLRSTAGLLDDSWFSRVRWSVGGRALAEYLIFSPDTVFGVGARSSMNVNAGYFAPGAEGYELFAVARGKAAAEPAGKKKKEPGVRKRWSVRVPVKVTSLVLAGQTLFAAGPPDVLDPAEPWAAYEGKRGGVLLAVSPATGETLAEYTLDSPPILDGLAAARGRLYVSQKNGRVLCFGSQDLK